MPDKITLVSVGSLQDTTTAATTINKNFTTIQTAFDNTLSRDGTTPNTMASTIDMNSNQIINLPAPSTVNSPARLIDVTSNPTISVPAVGTSGSTVGLLNTNNTTSGNNIHSGTETFSGNTTFNGTTNTFNGALTVGGAFTFAGTLANSQLATMGNNTIKGNVSGSTASPSDLSATQVATLLEPTLDARYQPIGGGGGGGIITADTYFKSGRPWADVRAWGAVGDGVTDNASVIQAAIDHMSTTFSGGIVFFPPGNYFIGSGIAVKTGVILMGAGSNCTGIHNQTNNAITLITFDTTCTFAGLEKIFIAGYTGVAPITTTIYISANVPVVFRDCYIWGGNTTINNQGTDGCIDNCFIQSWGNAGVVSNGANWYLRCKIDTQQTTTYGFLQGNYPPGGVCENHFTQCDFSGPYTDSVYINDGSNAQAITIFDGCVFSSPIVLTSQKWTTFNACEFGSTSFGVGGGSVSVVGCYAFSSMTLPTGVVKAGNINIA